MVNGNGFDASIPSANAIILSSGAMGTVTAATPTSLTVELTKLATTTGPLEAVVRTAGGLSSGGNSDPPDSLSPAPHATQHALRIRLAEQHAMFL